mmetsp:Transcript_13996/g.20739  ORF Transcript_13996/g.20739 Transcript_13996/m.20739 type:complete len:115 (-) Transcript_13996:86-430(-)
MDLLLIHTSGSSIGPRDRSHFKQHQGQLLKSIHNILENNDLSFEERGVQSFIFNSSLLENSLGPSHMGESMSSTAKVFLSPLHNTATVPGEENKNTSRAYFIILYISIPSNLSG